MLCVALTRARNELIITRRNGIHYNANVESQNAVTGYFLNELPADLAGQSVCASEASPVAAIVTSAATGELEMKIAGAAGAS